MTHVEFCDALDMAKRFVVAVERIAAAMESKNHADSTSKTCEAMSEQYEQLKELLGKS